MGGGQQERSDGSDEPTVLTVKAGSPAGKTCFSMDRWFMNGNQADEECREETGSLVKEEGCGKGNKDETF